MNEIGNPNSQSDDSVTEDTSFCLPPDRNVVFYNDDFTTMEFVVDVLISIFNKPHYEAEKLMNAVHENGSAVVGTYTFDIAVSRKNLAVQVARKNGFPLRVEVE